MKNPKISIITPSFNQGHFIEETICSVLDQGYPSLEYIIIDGGSTDNSVEIIKKYQKYLHYWESKKDKGQADAIYKGTNYASGEVINWLNSDDYLAPKSLFTIGAAFENPETNVFCGISRIFGIGPDRLSKGTDIYFDNLEKTIGMARIDQPETYFRKSHWDMVGGLNTGYHYLMDRDFWIRYLLRFGLDGIIKTPDLIANFRLHHESKTVSQQEKFTLEENYIFLSLTRALTGARTSSSTDIEPRGDYFFENKKHFGSGELIVNYFVLLKAKEAYAKNDYTGFDHWQSKINFNILDEGEMEDIKAIGRRRRFAPKLLKTGYHNIRRVFQSMKSVK